MGARAAGRPLGRPTETRGTSEEKDQSNDWFFFAHVTSREWAFGTRRGPGAA